MLAVLRAFDHSGRSDKYAISTSARRERDYKCSDKVERAQGFNGFDRDCYAPYLQLVAVLSDKSEVVIIWPGIICHFCPDFREQSKGSPHLLRRRSCMHPALRLLQQQNELREVHSSRPLISRRLLYWWNQLRWEHKHVAFRAQVKLGIAEARNSYVQYMSRCTCGTIKPINVSSAADMSSSRYCKRMKP